MTNEGVKSKIEFLVFESYKKSKDNNHKNLNFYFPKNKSNYSYLKDKLKIFKNLDEYSQTFLSIHTRAKMTLMEFKRDYFENNYLELLRLVLTLPESLNNKNLKSRNVTNIQKTDLKNEDRFEFNKNEKSNKDKKNTDIRKNTVLLKTGISGKQMSKEKEKFKIEQDELMDIEWDNNEDSDTEDFNSEEFNNINL